MLLRYFICMKDAFMEPKRDLYQILHVSKDADVAMITAAYKIRQEQLESKPDIESVNELKLVNWAYVTLRDSVTRAQYDMKIQSTATQASPAISYYRDASELAHTGDGKGKYTLLLLLVFGLAAAYLYSNHSNTAKHLVNEGAAVNGLVNNQSKEIDIAKQAEEEQARANAAREQALRQNQDTQKLAAQQREFEAQSRRDAMVEIIRQNQQAQQEQMKKAQDRMIQFQEQQQANRSIAYFACYNAARNAAQEAACARMR